MNCIESYLIQLQQYCILVPSSMPLNQSVFSSFLTPYGPDTTPPSDLDYPINSAIDFNKKSPVPIAFPESFHVVHGLSQALHYPDTASFSYTLHGVETRHDRFYISSNAIFDFDHTPLFLIVVNFTNPCIKFFFHPRVIDHSSFITRALYFQFLPLVTNVSLSNWRLFGSYANNIDIRRCDRQIVIADTSRFIISVHHSTPYRMFNYDFNSLVLKHLPTDVVQ